MATDIEYETTGPVIDNGTGPVLCFGVMLTSPPRCGGMPIVGLNWASVPWRSAESGVTWAFDLHLVGTYDGERLTLTRPPRRAEARRRREPDFAPAGDVEVIDTDADPDDFPPDDEIPDLIATWVTDERRVDRQGGFGPGRYIVNVVVRPGAAAGARDVIRQSFSGYLCVVEKNQPTKGELDAIQERILVNPRQLVPGWAGGSVNHQRGVVEVIVDIIRPETRDHLDAMFGPGVVELLPILRPVQE